jgi:hypothetical protein
MCEQHSVSSNIFCYLQVQEREAEHSPPASAQVKKIWIYTSTTPYDLTRVEAGSNTSTVTLRVVRGDEMGLKKAAP